MPWIDIRGAIADAPVARTLFRISKAVGPAAARSLHGQRQPAHALRAMAAMETGRMIEPDHWTGWRPVDMASSIRSIAAQSSSNAFPARSWLYPTTQPDRSALLPSVQSADRTKPAQILSESPTAVPARRTGSTQSRAHGDSERPRLRLPYGLFSTLRHTHPRDPSPTNRVRPPR